MPMPEFESRAVGLPERPLVPPGWTPLNYQNPAETFLSAYFAATNVNAKRLAIENQMAKLGLENERINNQREGIQLNYEAKMQGMENMDAYHRQEIMLGRDREDRISDAATRKLQEQHNQYNKNLDYQKALSDIDGDRGTQDYIDKGLILKAKYDDGSKDAERIWNQFEAGHIKAVSAKRNTIQDLNKNYDSLTTRYGLPEQWAPDKNKKGMMYKPVDSAGVSLPTDTPAEQVKAKGGKYLYMPKTEHDRWTDMRRQLGETTRGVDHTTDTTAPAKVRVTRGDGKQYWLPKEQIDEAVRQGFTVIGH